MKEKEGNIQKNELQGYIQKLETKMDNIEKLLIHQKLILTIDDLVELTGFSKGYIYILVNQGKIPAYKPTDGTLFFKQKEIIEFLTSKSK